MLNMRRSGIIFNEDHISFYKKKKKEVRLIVLEREIQLLKHVLIKLPVQSECLQDISRSQIFRNCLEYLFRPISYIKKKKRNHVLRGEKKFYSTARDIFKKALQEIGLEKSKFWLHSFRAGGDTAAANKGVCDRIFKKQGRWKSDSAKDGYVAENVHV